ncbi:hypothetical protein SS1G_07944 [Sclerotinia sclerotiorum 1980 UF-70]|uniref:Tyrosine specific protein phosphatases domain-containing protein n=1 Tax=Sclerotinia sclerotiorum (strain ATCC 18683 / 1980 / Ss-1) TaxID=665079 RepID=A7ERJ0_SCLS1|nr:hypothetical protein SS1G_07944 [Sclerotinia sclerotiorum 1980 UF-70]EDN92082.1 hypothetical protein SS1G_07944 [Sclerotinia sclerotiorum 1980 UF-70]
MTHPCSSKRDSAIDVSEECLIGQHEGASMPQADGCSSSKAADDEDERAVQIAEAGAAAAVDSKTAMPSFLKISHDGMQLTHFIQRTGTNPMAEMKAKYATLTKMEEERLANKDDPKWAREEPDRELDRYANVHPWAANRIRLIVPEGYNDYINASPVTLTSTAEKQSTMKKGIQDKYICMQGPKSQTVDHTWHMMWHSITVPDNAAPGVIIMLSPLVGPNPAKPEEMMEKCYQYYPMSEDDPPLMVNEAGTLGETFKAQVRFVKREENIEGTGIEVRKLAMSVEGEDEEKIIWHFFYPLWPDMGSLNNQNVKSVLTLMDLSRAKNQEEENPRVVHCSAGVGRTGTFVALEFLMGELQGGAWEGWDQSEEKGNDAIYETVDQLRQQRKTMVQAVEQYIFLYEVLRKQWEEKYRLPCFGGEHTHDSPPEEGKNAVFRAIPENK